MPLKQSLKPLVVLLVMSQTTLTGGVQALPSRASTRTADHRFAALTQSDRSVAMQWQQLGSQQYQTGQFEAAIKSWQQARTIYQQLQDPLGEGVMLTSLGATYVRLERYREAIAVLEAFQSLAPQVNDRRMEAQVLSNLGIAYAALGSYAQAIEVQRQAGKLMQTIGNRQGLGQVLVNLGNAFEAVGDYDNATIAYQQSLKIARQANNPASEGTALGNLGSVYSSLGQYDDAITAQQQSLALAKAMDNQAGQANTLLHLGTVYHAQGDRQRAIGYYTDSLAIAKQMHNRKQTAEALGSLGLAYEDLKDYPKSIAYYEQSLAIAQTLDDPQLDGRALNNLGHALFRAGRLADAETRLRAAIARLDALRPGLSDTYKTSIFDTQTYSYNLLQKILLAAQKPEAALEIAEHGRARAFVELLARRVEGAGEQGEQRSQGKQGDRRPDNQPLTTNNQQLAVQPISLAAIKAVAQQHNATLVEYAIMSDDDFKAQGKQRARESELFIWVVQPTGDIAFRRVDLKPLWQDKKTLTEVVRDARCLTALCVKTVKDSTSTRRLRLYPGLRKLHQLLIEPIADLLPNSPTARLIFIPQTTLFLVPFVALQDANGKYLIEDHTLSTAPAIQVLELTQQQRERLSQRSPHPSLLSPLSSLLIGNPTMPFVSTEPGQPPEQLPSLPGAEKEVLAIAQLLGTQAIIGKQATKVSLLKKLPAARLIHLATHGLLEYDSQKDRSQKDGGQKVSLKGLGIPGAIALAPSGTDDGLLTTSDVLNLRLNAELVTLSACDTGQGRITGDGVVGLSRAFISAGVPSVMVSLWAVSDAATATLMTTFYRTLQQQPDKAQALRQAMLTTMKEYPYPIDWAAFTLIGEAE